MHQRTGTNLYALEAQTYFSMPSGDYDWVDLYRNEKLRKLYNNELDKYLKQHGMGPKTYLTKKDNLSVLKHTQQRGYLLNYKKMRKILMIRV